MVLAVIRVTLGDLRQAIHEATDPTRPTHRAVQAALDDIRDTHHVDGYELRLEHIDDLIASEDLDSKYVRSNLVAAYQRAPQDVPPIVVQGREILEGHHRFVAARAAGLTYVWVVDVAVDLGVLI